MIDQKFIVKTISAVISKNSDTHVSGLVLGNSGKPQYNNGINNPKVCSMGLDICKDFYQSLDGKAVIEKECPFGFKVSKKTVETNTKYKAITIYVLLSFTLSPKTSDILTDLPRHLKDKRDETVRNLEKLELNEQLQLEYRDFLDSLLDTLLVGRIGLTIQSLSHQFFTPLQGAMADLKNIEEGLETADSVKRLRKNFDSLTKLATEVQLLLSSTEEFNPNMLRRVTVHSMISDIFESLVSAANEKHINLNQKFNNYSKTVSAIPGQLHIVLSNIIQNAIKYSFNGYPNANLLVEVSYEQESDHLSIAIENEGCKITDEEIRDGLLFELGYRGVHSRDRQRKGTGSGLFICREITKSHGGSILVYSKFVGGSIELKTDRYRNIFTVLWPIFHDN